MNIMWPDQNLSKQTYMSYNKHDLGVMIRTSNTDITDYLNNTSVTTDN